MVKRILLIEDDAFMRGLLESYLGKEHVVDAAANGLEGVEKMSTTMYDLVISDKSMPFLTGNDVLDFIGRKLKYTPKVLVMSSSNTEFTSFKSYNLGASVFLQKPFSFKRFQQTVEKLINE